MFEYEEKEAFNMVKKDKRSNFTFHDFFLLCDLVVNRPCLLTQNKRYKPDKPNHLTMFGVKSRIKKNGLRGHEFPQDHFIKWSKIALRTQKNFW